MTLLSPTSVTARNARFTTALSALSINLTGPQMAAVLAASGLDTDPTIDALHLSAQRIRALIALWTQAPKHTQILNALATALGYRTLAVAQAQLPVAPMPQVADWTYTPHPVSTMTFDISMNSLCEYKPLFGLALTSAASVRLGKAVGNQPDAWTDGHTLHIVPPADFYPKNYSSHMASIVPHVAVGLHLLLGHADALREAANDPTIDLRLFALALDIRALHVLLTHAPGVLPKETIVSVKHVLQEGLPASMRMVFEQAFVPMYPDSPTEDHAFWGRYTTPMAVYTVLTAVRNATFDISAFPRNAQHTMDALTGLIRQAETPDAAEETVGDTAFWQPSVVMPTYPIRVGVCQHTMVTDLFAGIQSLWQNDPNFSRNFWPFETTALDGSIPTSFGPAWDSARQVVAFAIESKDTPTRSLDSREHYQELIDYLRALSSVQRAQVVLLLMKHTSNMRMALGASRSKLVLDRSHQEDLLDFMAETLDPETSKSFTAAKTQLAYSTDTLDTWKQTLVVSLRMVYALLTVGHPDMATALMDVFYGEIMSVQISPGLLWDHTTHPAYLFYELHREKYRVYPGARKSNGV